jgi:hypothetical protein
LEVPLTIAYLINKFLPSTDENKENQEVQGNELLTVEPGIPSRRITIHLVGAEKEADLLPLFEVLLPFFPNTSLCIHMIGPAISPSLPPEQRAILIQSKALNSSIFVSVSTSLYTQHHIDGDAFQLPPNLPEELKKAQNFGTGPPDLIIAMNAALVVHQEWAECIQIIAKSGKKFLITERMEQMCNAIAVNLPKIGVNLAFDAQPNPFKMPVFEFKKDVNLPGWSNGFIVGIGQFD